MDDDEWMEPPVDHLLDYVPVGARPLFAEQFREMLWWLERDSRNEARWFLLLRAWPVLVTGPIRHGGPSATKQLVRRLELWREFRFEELYDDVLRQRRVREATRAQSAGKRSKEPPKEVTYERASIEARDGYLSRAAAVLSEAPLAMADEATWRGLEERCPGR